MYRLDWSDRGSSTFKAAPCGAEAIPFGSHIVTLDNTEENLWSAVHSKHRNVIRKARQRWCGDFFRGGRITTLIYDSR